MKVLGYSERGVVNSLFYDIAFSLQPDRLLGDLLATAHFPFQSDLRFEVRDAKVLLEQSLSDFGDADAILLLRPADTSVAVFTEAKVKPFQVSEWQIQQEYQDFIAGTRTKGSSSNLFTQLYHKVCLADVLKRGALDGLANGVEFPASSSKATRNIGRNGVVLKAVEELRRYLDQVYFLALVPDDVARVSEFFERVLTRGGPPGYRRWGTSGYGHLSWHEVEDFCKRHDLKQTLAVLEFNEGQIY